MRGYFGLSLSFSIQTRYKMLNSSNLIYSIRCEQPKYNRNLNGRHFETDHVIFSICIQMLYFTSVRYVQRGKWHANQVH